MFGVPLNTVGIIYIYIGIFCYWVLLHYNMSFITIAGGGGGLMVLSDGMVHFLKIKKKNNKSTKFTGETQILWL